MNIDKLLIRLVLSLWGRTDSNRLQSRMDGLQTFYCPMSHLSSSFQLASWSRDRFYRQKRSAQLAASENVARAIIQRFIWLGELDPSFRQHNCCVSNPDNGAKTNENTHAQVYMNVSPKMHLKKAFRQTTDEHEINGPQSQWYHPQLVIRSDNNNIFSILGVGWSSLWILMACCAFCTVSPLSLMSVQSWEFVGWANVEKGGLGPCLGLQEFNKF